MCPITFQKADGNASGFYKYPRADEIQTRSNPHKSRISLPAWTELDELSNSSVIRKPSSTNPSKNSPSNQNSNQNLQQPNPKTTDPNHGRFCSSDDKLCNRWCGNLRPEGIFGLILWFSSAYQASETETLKHDTIRTFLNFWTSGVRHPSAASLQSRIFLSWPTNPWKPHRFNLLWSK